MTRIRNSSIACIVAGWVIGQLMSEAAARAFGAGWTAIAAMVP